MTPRPRCDRCLRPPVACVCGHRVPVAHRTPVLVLQHPLEAGHAKNSARLLHLSLRDSRLETGEVFDDAALHRWCGDGAVLLYPADAASRPMPADGRPARLVVIDATWRKSRRMLAMNPRLAALPRLSLDDPPPSRYTTRRAHRPAQRSTLEATLGALGRLDGDDPSHAALLAAFEAMQGTWHARAAAGAAASASAAGAARPCNFGPASDEHG